mgnify:CR=1 FL=1
MNRHPTHTYRLPQDDTLEAFFARQVARARDRAGRVVRRYRSRVSEAYDVSVVEHKGFPQSTGSGPHNAWRRMMGRERGSDRL